MKNQQRASSSLQPKNFSPYLSCQRLKKAQSTLRSEESGKDVPDALLAILGIDSRYNEGCRELADYLLFGFFTQRQMELEQAGLEEEDIEDVILVIRPMSVSVYCKAVLYDYLLPCVTHWSNLQIFCLSGEENEKDEKNAVDDAEDDFKIRSFVSMLDGCSVVGIPYLASPASLLSQGAQGKDKKIKPEKDGMALDKWPLIQSYASEQSGCGSPFSSNHNVLNVRERLMALYNQCDPVSMEKMVKKSYPLFTRHWEEAVSTVDTASQNNSLLTLEEAAVAEHLQCYFKHGQLSKLRLGKKSSSPPATGKQPFVLFGSGTVNSAPRSKTFTLKGSTKKGQDTAYQMTMQCVAPRCGISCSRTYFFKPADTSESIRREFNDLVRLYGLCVEGAGMAMDTFTALLDSEAAERKAKDHLISAGATGGLVFDAKCNVAAADLSGREIKITTGKASPHLKTVRVAAENVKASHKGENLGSVVFMETFLESSFVTGNGDKEVDNSEISYILLTEDIPVYMEWNIKKSVARTMDGDSNPAILCEDVTVCSNSPLYSPPCNVDLLFYQDGTVSVCCNKNELFTLESVLTYYDSKLPGKVGLLVANFDSFPKWMSVPAHMRSEVALNTELGISATSKCVVFTLLPGSKAYREFYAKVLHESQNSNSMLISIKVVESLSSNLAAIHTTVQELLRKGIPLKRDTFKQKKVSAEQLKLSDFLMHFTISSVVGELLVPSALAEMMLRRGKSTQLEAKDAEEKVSITILFGYPCSGAEELSASLVSLNKEKVRWVIIRPNAPSSNQKNISTIDRENLEDQLSQAIARKKVSRPGLASRKKMRIMLLAVGFFDPRDIVQCVVSHHDPAVRVQMVIGAATTCVSPHSVFLNNKQTFPKFFEMCRSGLISNIAFKISDSESGNDKDETLASVQSLIRSINPRVAFLSCVDGKLSRQREYELILSESSFESNEISKERQLLMPALWLGKEVSGACHPEVSEITLDFSQPLIKGSFCARLRALKSSLTSQQDVGSIYFVTGCIAFLDEPSQQYDLKFSTLVGEVSLHPRIIQAHLPTPPPNETNACPKTKSHHLKFYGSKSNEDALKDWVRKCGRQKPSKKTRRTVDSLSKNELKEIQEDNRTMPLPEGYFFNGSFYVNLMDDRKTMEHPFMKKFIEEYLREENRAIDVYNAKIDKQNIKDVFE